MKHTPAPWYAAPDGSDGFVVFSESYGAIARLHDPLCRELDRFEELKANAVMIASAPEVRRMLGQCLRYLADLNGSEWIKGTDTGSVDMRQRAKALHRLVYEIVSKLDGVA